MSRERGDYRGGRDRYRDDDRGGGRDRRDDRGGGRDRRRSSSRDRRDDRQGDSSSSLLVRNLSYNITSDDMRRLFDKYGDIRDVYMPMDYHTRKPRGFAFVEFYDARDARAALHALDRYSYDGRELAIVFAKDKRKSSDEMKRISNTRGGSRDRDDNRDRGDSRRDMDRRGSKDYDNKRSPSRESDRGGDEGRRRKDSDHSRDRSPSASPARSNGKDHDEDN